MNEIKATVAELETAREEQTDDICSLVIILLFLPILFQNAHINPIIGFYFSD